MNEEKNIQNLDEEINSLKDEHDSYFNEWLDSILNRDTDIEIPYNLENNIDVFEASLRHPLTNMRIIREICSVLSSKPKYRIHEQAINQYSLFPPLDSLVKENRIHSKRNHDAIGIMCDVFSKTGVTVKNTESDALYKDIGIDIVTTSEHGTVTNIKVIADDMIPTEDTPEKIFKIQTVENTDTGNPGWVYTSHADIICYCSIEYNVYFCLDLRALRGFIKNNICNVFDFPIIYDRTNNFYGDMDAYSESRLLSFNDMLSFLVSCGYIPQDVITAQNLL